MSAIKPALTAEEWAVETMDGLGTRLTWAAKEAGVNDEVSRHALAALALYGQPFGFTHEDVELLHRGGEAIVSLAAEGYGDQREANAASDRMGQLADRIAALLPEKP